VKSVKHFLFLLILGLVTIGSNSGYSQNLLGSKIEEGFELYAPLQDATFMKKGDDPVDSLVMPFTFKYDNQTISKIYIYGNGFISLNTYRNPSALAIPKLYSFPNIISWYCGDLVTEDGLYYKLTGISPFRVLTIEQRQARTFGEGGGNTFDVQIRFYETSNQVKITYGNTAGLGGGGTYGWIYFTGATASNYINIQPNDPNYPSTFYYSDDNPNQNRWIRDDAPFKIPRGKYFTLNVLPTLIKVNPDGKYVLSLGNVYNDSINRPYVLISRDASQYPVALQYNIYGPVGSPTAQTIYVGLETITDQNDITINFSPQPVGNFYRYDISAAKGFASAPNGALDLLTNQSQIERGLYTVTATLQMIGQPSLNQTVQSQFYIAQDYDLNAMRIVSPVKKEESVYRYGDHNIPLILRVQNVGKFDLTYFKVVANIYTTNDVFVKQIIGEWNNINDPLSRDEYTDFQLPSFDAPSIGDYYVIYTVYTDEYHPDGYLNNNVITAPGEPKLIFSVNYETELALTSVLAPQQSVYVNVPVRPGIRLQNNSSSDLSDIPLTITITKGGQKYWERSAVIDVVRTGIANARDFYIDDIFVPTEAGSYIITFKAPVDGDELPFNNTISISFNVLGGLSGDYTISATGSGSRNYLTFQDAADALYKFGVSGPVNFKLLDYNYDVGNPFDPTLPALDLTSKISGMSATNTVTFKPSEEISSTGGVQIHLKTGSGIGILFGQTISPSNLNAPANKVTDKFKSLYANSEGYIIFDGGENYVIKFILETNNASFRAPFYLGNGASNITLKNLIITDNFPLFKHHIPLISYTASADKEFNYQPDQNITAAVYIRSVAPYDSKTGFNSYKIDTLVNRGNRIIGNKISGFGYGVVDLGIGLLKRGLSDEILAFYNTDNLVSKNTMTSLGYAGVFAGYEKDSRFEYNRIDNVQANDYSSAGMVFGGKQEKFYFGYYNTSIIISGNEISNIKNPNTIAGILVEQAGSAFGSGSSYQFFPTFDNITVENNIVRDLNATNQGTNIYGIILRTQRDLNIPVNAQMTIIPQNPSYLSTNNKVVNNTILIDDLNEETFLNTGEIVGAGFAQIKNSEFINNAVSIKDMLINPNNDIATAVFYYGQKPEALGSTFNTNVYWTKESTADLYRFIETDANAKIYEYGVKNEFVNLAQWQGWTAQEKHSVEIYPFLNDYTVSTDNPSLLRMRKEPQVKGSALDGRGEALSYNQYDIDGNIRGYAGHRYDVGAEQFDGTPFMYDVEILNYETPLKYQASPGFPFDDAEYMMTDVPVEVKVRVRNNGNMVQSGVKLNVSITRESKSNRFEDGTQVVSQDLIINGLAPGEIRVYDFNMADGIQPDFTPEAYSQFIGTPFEYTNIPSQFKMMIGNVSPRYKLSASVIYDENNPNNIFEKAMRFYIRRSNIKMLLSTESWQTIDTNNLPTDPNIIAANLNLDTLTEGLYRLGWYRNLDREDPHVDYDIFDRKAWERRDIDYTIYRSLFWIDGHDTYGAGSNNEINIYEFRDLQSYLNSGSSIKGKKNLFISSQDFVRNNQPLYTPEFEYLYHAAPLYPGTPMFIADNDFIFISALPYTNYKINGNIVARNQQFTLLETYWEGKNHALYPDNMPFPGLLQIVESASGIARIGMLYDTVTFNPREYTSIDNVPAAKKIASITVNSVPNNIVLNGVEWRHWNLIEVVLRAMIDYADANGGYVVPIELLNFEASQASKRVDLNWTTASEVNSLRFDIERASIQNQLRTDFEKINEVATNGSATTITHYGPISDKNVEFGDTYIYRLKMIDKNGEFKYSDEKSITLLSDGVSLSIDGVHPNPVQTSANLSISLAGQAPVQAILYDVNGMEISTLFDGIMSAGTKDLDINAQNLSSGVYNIVIKINGDIFVKTFTVVK
jgi:hypothetical protein